MSTSELNPSCRGQRRSRPPRRLRAVLRSVLREERALRAERLEREDAREEDARPARLEGERALLLDRTRLELLERTLRERAERSQERARCRARS